MPPQKEIVELPVEHLRLGLYVSQLDRPWIESPFLFQGFEIETDEELKQLRELCKVVHVEVNAEIATELKTLLLARAPKPRAAEPPRVHSSAVLDELAKNPSARRGLVPPKDSVPLKTELVAAKEAHGAAKKAVTGMVDRLRRGRGLDVPHMESVVDPMVDSVMRNRDAISWLATLRDKDDYIYSHSLATSVWALAFGRQLGLDKDTLKAVGLGAMLMDIGKTRLPNDLLNKVDPTAEEMQTLRGHVGLGLEIVKAAPGMDERVIAMIATHHERYDGSGYPKKLKADQIPMIGRIGGIVDSYDAMTSVRAYAKAKSTYDAVRELKKLSDIHFQGELIELFIQSVGVFPTGTLVELNTGEVGVVVGQNRFRRLRPEIMLILDADKKLRKDFVTIDLQTFTDNSAAQPAKEKDKDNNQPALWITHGLEPGAYGIDPTEYFL